MLIITAKGQIMVCYTLFTRRQLEHQHTCKQCLDNMYAIKFSFHFIGYTFTYSNNYFQISAI